MERGLSTPMEHSSFTSYWHATKPFLHTGPFNLPIIISAATAIFLVSKIGLFEWTANNLAGYIFLSIILCGLPFLHSVNYKNRLAAATAITLQVCIISLESIFGRKQCMTSFLAFVILFRIMYYRTFFDNFALCLAFSSNVGSTTRGQVSWYYNSNLMIWSYFFIALFLQHTYKRNSARIWQHLHLLLILKERMKFEKERSSGLISAHLSKDIIDHAHSTTTLAQSGSEIPKELAAQHEDVLPPAIGPGRLTPNKIEKFSMTKSPPAIEERRFPFIAAALGRGIVSEFVEGPTTVDMLAKLDHSDRRNTTVIAIRIGGSGSECALDHKIRNIVFAIFDQISVQFKITPIRRFGSTWVGCLGFFHSLDSDVLNCYATLQFACHVLLALKKYDVQLAFALEFGNIIGGFVNCPNFELFGQEIRLVFQMTDLQFFGRIILGDGSRQLLSQQRRQQGRTTNVGAIDAASNTPIMGVAVDKVTCNVPWVAGATSSVSCISNPSEFVRKEDLNDSVLTELFLMLSRCFDVELVDMINEPKSHSRMQQGTVSQLLNCDRDYGFDFNILKARPDVQDLINQWAHNRTEVQQQYRDHAQAPKDRDGDVHITASSQWQQIRSTWYSFWDPSYWMEDLGIEFRTSIRERYGFDVDEACALMSGCSPRSVSGSCTEQDLVKMHHEMERELYDVVKTVFLSSFSSLFNLGVGADSSDVDADVDAEVIDSSIKLRSGATVSNVNPLLLIGGGWFFSLLEPGEGQVRRESIRRWMKSFFFQPHKYTRVAVECAPTKSQSIHDDDQRLRSKARMLFESEVGFAADQSASSEKKQRDEEPCNQSPRHPDSDFSEYGQRSTLNMKRTWHKYSSDARLVVHHSLLNFFINLVFVCMSFVVLRDYLQLPVSSERRALTGFIQLYVLHGMLALTLERVYGRMGNVVMIALRALVFITIPSDLLLHTLFSKDLLGSEYGDFGGDVVMLLFLTFRIPSHLCQSASLSLVDGIISRGIIIVRQLESHHYWQPQAHLSASLVLLALDFCYWIIVHRCFVSYLVEHRLLPFALEQYRLQVINTRAVLHILSPEASYKFNKDIFKPNFYRNSALAAVHVKAADKLSSFLSPQDFCSIMDRVNEMVNEAFAESGMLKVSNFSGVHVAVVCKDASWDRITGLRVPSSHTARAVLLLRVIRARLDKFCKSNNINIAVGIGISAGPCCLGLLGSNHFHFDVEGDVRDRAVSMASYNSDAVYASSRIKQELAKVFPAEDLLHRQKVADSWGDAYWFQIDSTFNGIQLNDFTYKGMLGKGGYGAVHLLCEKYTNKFYAIKAMPLKENSVMSRMMQRECIILQRMNHENVVSLKYAFMANNQLYLVMSYHSCGNLKQVIDRDNPSLSVMRLWFAELVLAIEYVHSVGIIHRDIKPANCMIDSKGHLKLADFGLSKIIREPVGPEVVENNSVSMLGVNEDVHVQLQKFLPLKAYLANRATKEETCSVPLLFISDIGTEQESFDKLFGDANFRLNVTRVRQPQAAVNELKKRNIEAIFIDGASCDKNPDDLLELVRIMRTSVRSHVPIYIVQVPPGLSLRAIEKGAKECFEESLEQLEEVTCRRLFSLQQDRTPSARLDASPQGAGAGTGAGTGQAQSLNLSSGTSASHSIATNPTAPRSDLPKDEEHTIVGTIHYIAPEVIKDRKYGEPVDWWALGITIYVCIMRQHVFQGNDVAELREMIANGPVNVSALKEKDEDAHALVERILVLKPEDRLCSAAAIRVEPYFRPVPWGSVSTMDMPLMPAEFELGKYDLKEKLLFYGEPDGREKLYLTMQQMDARSSTLTNLHKQNRKSRRSGKNRHNSSSLSRLSSQQMQTMRTQLVSGNYVPAQQQPRERRGMDLSGSALYTEPVMEEMDEDEDFEPNATGSMTPLATDDAPVPLNRMGGGSVRSFSDYTSRSMNVDSL